MNDQRVVTGSTFGLEDLEHGGVRSGVAAQPVDGFGGESDELVLGEQESGLLEMEVEEVVVGGGDGGGGFGFCCWCC